MIEQPGVRRLPRLVRPVRVDPVGRAGPTPKQARGPRWRRVSPGWFVPAGTPLLPEQRALEASVRLPPGGMVTGWWAVCRLHGAVYLDGCAPDGRTMLPVPLTLPGSANLRPQPGVALLRGGRAPPETRVRLVYVLDAGLPYPLVNHPVLDAAGHFLGTPNLLDPQSGHAVEYDGAEHRTRACHARDVDGESGLRGAGCELTRVVAPNLTRPDRLVQRLREGSARAYAAPPARRTWTLGDPGPTLDERIAEREEREPWWRDQSR